MPAISLTGTVDPLHGHVTLNLPVASTVTPDIPDRYQIGRRRGWSQPATGLDIICDIPAGRTKFIDRNPFAFRTSYFIRGRIHSNPDTWTAWSAVWNSTLTTTPLHSTILSPFNSLELKVISTGETLPAAVEQARAIRYNVIGQPTYQVLIDFRAKQTITTTDRLRLGFRWYRKDGVIVAESYDEVVLDLVDSQSQAGRLVHEQTPPAGATKMGMFFEIQSTGTTDTTLRVRVENLELYRHEGDHNSGWEYLQVPSTQGVDPDTRVAEVDQTVFAYDGVGWSYLAAPPASSAIRAPYRQSSTPEDEVSFLTNGNFIDLLFYGHTSPAFVEISRLVDSALGKSDPAGQEGPSLWEPVNSDQVTGAVPLYGPNLCYDSVAESGAFDLDGWELINSSQERLTVDAIPETEPQRRTTDVRHNGLFNVGGTTLARQTGATKITGTGSYEMDIAGNAGGVSYPFIGVPFKAGATYRVRFKIRKVNGAVSVVAIMGSTPVTYFSPTESTGYDFYFHDRYFISMALTDTPTEYTFYWTPVRDTATAYFAIRQTTGTGGLAVGDKIIFDDVEVREQLGYTLPAGADFAPIRLALPGYFSPRHATPYRIKVISGVVRPYGVVRDTANTIDLKQDFTTYLRSLGDIRNLSLGELEFRPDHNPPTVYHHARRGRDHERLKNGLDLRYGKNILTRKRSVDALTVTNRLIVVGYGDDRTQLVHELRALKDVQKRLPSDPSYLLDANGVHRDTVVLTNLVKNPSLRDGLAPWGLAESAGYTNNTGHNTWVPYVDTLKDAGAWRANVTSPDATVRTTGIQTNNTASDLSPVAASTVYTATCMVFVASISGGPTFRIDMTGYDNAVASTGTQTGTNKSLSPGWNLITQTWQTPVGTTYLRLNPEFRTAAAGNIDGYITQVGLWKGDLTANPPDFFDGSTLDAARWTGTPNASTSELLAKHSIWDPFTGGTSEDIYGIRYGVYREAQLTTLYQAQIVGQELVELSAWPNETFDISVADLDTIPAELQPGDTITFPYKGRTFKKRVIEINHDMAKPRQLDLVLGDDSDELTKPIERITRDVETAISGLNAGSTG